MILLDMPRDLAAAVGLSAFAFVIGPFVYWGHEKAWDHFGERKQADGGADNTRLLPAPA